MAIDLLRPSFSLVDYDGKVVTESDFRGKYSVVFFGFTNCAVVCPRALAKLSEVLDSLGNTIANDINALYISVDPARDTPEAMKEFLSQQFPRFVGLTGTTDEAAAARRAFRVHAKVKEDSNAPDGYSVPHTAIAYFLDKNGALLDHFVDSLSGQAMKSRIQKLLDLPSNTNVPVSEMQIEYSEKPEALTLLDRKQVASIRHIKNLAQQLKGDWSGMMGATHLNDGFGGYRFQLAYAFYALSLAHFHRLPAAPGYFQVTMEKMIGKMLDPDVWFYWHDASKGGGFLHTPTSEGNFDPIVTDNIMYSSYVQTMAILYNMLFGDTRYTKPGALTLEYNMHLWGPPGGVKFEYDQNSINDKIYWNMVQEGYLGVACEPYCIFQICNQVPIIGFRLNDMLKGNSDVASEVTQGYLNAWKDFAGGLLGENGTLNTLYATHISQTITIPSSGMEAWCGFLMNSWNGDFVKAYYNDRIQDLLVRQADGSLTVNIGPIEGLSPNMLMLHIDAQFGWVSSWAAEMGDKETTAALLDYADKNFKPCLQSGGLTYPRNDTPYDRDGKFVAVAPILANAQLPLTRLNVPNGLKRLYETPWGIENADHYSEPALEEVDFDVDIYRAVYIPSSNILMFDVAVWKRCIASIALSRVFGRGTWALKRGEEEIAHGDTTHLVSGIDKDLVRQEGKRLVLTISNTEVESFTLQWLP
jgi:cytochrome oxidase Cu insertion factor (SCO1/SenC/PrrC family)